MGFLDWLFGVRVQEANVPKPREEKPVVDPVGYPNQVDPLAQIDRKSPVTVISAALRAAEQTNRVNRYEDFNKMDVSDVAAMLDAVVDAALTFDDVTTGRGFKVECDTPRAEELLQAAIEDADLRQLAQELLRDLLKYGDCFAEPIFAGQQLVDVQTYEPAQINVAKDDKGKLVKGKDADNFFAAFQQKRNGKVVAGWQPWELIHGKYWPSRKLIYSQKGLLDDLRPDWRKLQAVELGMVVARVTRAYPRRVHMVDMTGKERGEQERTLTNYINRMTGRSYGKRVVSTDGIPASDVSEDLYVATGYTTGPDNKPVPKLNSVKTEDPAIAGLAELGDVDYLRQKVWSTVPSDVVGIKRNTSGDLDSQDIAYGRLLRRCQRQLELVMRGILDQVLLANGILPSTTEYRVVFPVITVGAAWKHSDARFKDSMTVRNHLEIGIVSRRFAAKRAYNLSDREVDEMWGEIEEEMMNPIFQLQVAPARNGQPSAAPSAAGAANKAGNDGSAPAPTAPTGGVIPATGASPSRATTKTGIDRGTKQGQALRGHLSGG